MEPLSREEMQAATVGLAMPVKSRFDAPTLARSGFTVMAAALGVPDEAAWDSQNQGQWENCAGYAINTVERAGISKEPFGLEPFALQIASMMGSDYASQTIEERIGWGGIARLWANAVKSTDLDLETIQKEAVGYVVRKVNLAKPAPAPSPPANGRFLAEAMQAAAPAMLKQPVNGNGTAAQNSHVHHSARLDSSPGLHQVIDLKIQDLQQKIESLRALKNSLPPAASQALWEVLQDVLKGDQ